MWYVPKKCPQELCQPKLYYKIFFIEKIKILSKLGRKNKKLNCLLLSKIELGAAFVPMFLVIIGYKAQPSALVLAIWLTFVNVVRNFIKINFPQLENKNNSGILGKIFFEFIFLLNENSNKNRDEFKI